MRGIPVERLIELHRKSSNTEHRFLYNWLIAQECQELQEPWMTLDEFLKSGFIGECWICLDTEEVYRASYGGVEKGFSNIHGYSFRWAEKR